MTTVTPLSVSEFLSRLNAVLEEQVAWVEGEITDLRLSQGRWIHFDLKDANALVHCFGLQFRIRVPLEDGMKVRVWGVPKVYPRYGKLSLTVDIVEPSGEGALRRAFELLKKTLEAEGLFLPERKRPLPRFPERIGLVTSKEAAAYSDFLKVLRARRGGMEIVFVPALVQGREAPEEIIRALDLLNECAPPLDAVVLVRGGGGLEELQAFNDERVVRALARSRIPTIVGVGHERDISLADLAADVRGSTPSNAAELLTPTRAEILADLSLLVRRMDSTMHDQIVRQERQIQRAVHILRESVYETVHRITSLAQRMLGVSRLLSSQISRYTLSVARDIQAMKSVYERSRQEAIERIESLERLLGTLHPTKVLKRGFSITRTGDGTIIRDSATVTPGESLLTTLAHGTLHSIIDSHPLWRKNQRTSRKRTKSSKASLPPLKQATLI